MKTGTSALRQTCPASIIYGVFTTFLKPRASTKSWNTCGTLGVFSILALIYFAFLQMYFKLRNLFLNCNIVFFSNLLVSVLIFNNVSWDLLHLIKLYSFPKVRLIYQFVDLSTDFVSFAHFHKKVIHFRIHYCKVTVTFGCSCNNTRHTCNPWWFFCYVFQIKSF